LPGAGAASRLAHIGFTTVGLALGTSAALGASILYMLHHMLVITSLFLVSGWFLRQRRTTNLSSLGALYRTQPAVAAVAMVPVFSLAGVPPLSGFIGKLAVVTAALAGDHYWVAGIALIVSLLTVLSMARLWEAAFWKPAPTGPRMMPLGSAIVAPVAVLVALTLALSVVAGPVFELSKRAAEQLLNSTEYVGAVLAPGR
jgi:multicomponent Na+:H+ antiporter subunit D